MTTLRDLLAETARQHDCTVEALKGPARRPELIAARWDFVRRAWQGLLSHVYEDGRLGCIQPIGAAPGAFSETSSYVYGTGAFLLAGSEVYKLARE